MKFFSKISLLLFVIPAIFSSCKKDKLTTDPSAKLSFSRTSILYDTVFTTVGSATKTFLVYNKNSQAIKISSIKLGTGSSSSFRINVDGQKGTSFSNIEIKSKDSIFVFAEVTVNPNNTNSPLVIRDSIVFVTNGNVQNVKLEAWGQDAYFHTPTIFPADGFPGYSVISSTGQNTTWKNDKPHVIYAYAVVDSGSSLTMQPGTRVYMHPNAVLYVNKGGSLSITGSNSLPVTIQGDRLESEYAEAAGQWGWIHLSAQSTNNVINWAIIKNGYIGILCDTLGSANPTLKIYNSIVRNMSVAAIYGRGTFMQGWNCVFANCGQYVAALSIGGKYDFYHCTFANYWNQSTRQFPTLLLNNYYKDANENIIPRSLDSASFYNCIVYGDLTSGDEIKLDNASSATFNYKFHNCLLRTTFNTSASQYENVIVNKEPYFYNIAGNDYRIRNPLALDAVIDKGDIVVVNEFPNELNYDLSNLSRLANPPPDIGAYEYQP